MKELLLVLVVFGSLGSIAFGPSAVRCRLMVVVLSRLQSCIFVPNFLIITHRFPEKQRFLFWHIACAKYLSRQLRYSREVSALRKPDTIDGKKIKPGYGLGGSVASVVGAYTRPGMPRVKSQLFSATKLAPVLIAIVTS